MHRIVRILGQSFGFRGTYVSLMRLKITYPCSTTELPVQDRVQDVSSALQGVLWELSLLF